MNLDRNAVARVVGDHVCRRRREDGTLRSLLGVLESSCGDWALVGGAPRTWATKPHEEPRDLDIVVSASRESVERALDSAVVTSPALRGASIGRTSLGGFRVHAGASCYDLWAADTTLNVASGRVPFSNAFRAVAYSAPLSLDTLVVTSRGAVYERGFFKSLEIGVLTIRDADVVGPAKLAEKALRLCRTHNLLPDLVLQTLMVQHVGGAAVEALRILLAKTPRSSGTLATDSRVPAPKWAAAYPQDR
jgi:hypothetical protein